MTKIYLYRIVYDTGYAPNFEHNIATLAACKPQIRKTAQVGDWIIGLASKKFYKGSILYKNLPENTIVWCMKVSNKITYKEYDELCLSTFVNKIPCKENDYRGDCQIKADGTFRDGEHSPCLIHHDLTGKFVLIGKKYYYSKCSKFEYLPDNWNCEIVKRGHRVFKEITKEQEKFLEKIIE